MQKLRPKLLSAIIIFLLLSSLLQIFNSFPIYGLKMALNRGGVITKSIIKVESVIPDSPAANAGLLTNDKILSINNQTINSAKDFLTLLRFYEGQEVTLHIKRNEKVQIVQLSPKVNPNPENGRIGLYFTETQDVEYLPTSQLITKVIINAYSGIEERPVPILGLQENENTSYYFKDSSYSRLESLCTGIIYIILCMGLWKLKKWALYSYIITCLIMFLINIFSFILLNNLGTFEGNNKLLLTIGVFILGYIIQILIIYYLYRRKYLFR